MGARERGIERDGLLEETPRSFIVGPVEPVHVPEAAMMRLPRVKRTGRLEDGAVALDGLDLAGDGCDDAIANLVEHDERVLERLAVDLRPDHPRAARLSQLHRHLEAIAPPLRGSADDVIDVQHPA